MIRQAPYLTVRANANSLTVTFHDHFSDRAAQYVRSRPGYPPELVDYLADIAPEAERVWEAGCGSTRQPKRRLTSRPTARWS